MGSIKSCHSLRTRRPDDLRGTNQARTLDDVQPHAAAAEHTVYPYRPVVLDGKGLDDIAPPARPTIPPLMRGYLRLGARVCGEPAHDPEFGVGDFPALLDKRQADTRYLTRLRSVSAASEMADGVGGTA